jgi:hypothetical protein
VCVSSKLDCHTSTICTLIARLHSELYHTVQAAHAAQYVAPTRSACCRHAACARNISTPDRQFEDLAAPQIQLQNSRQWPRLGEQQCHLQRCRALCHNLASLRRH